MLRLVSNAAATRRGAADAERTQDIGEGREGRIGGAQEQEHRQDVEAGRRERAFAAGTEAEAWQVERKETR